MRSRTTRRFRRAFSRLPEPIKERTRQAYRRFVENPDHPGLRFKRIHSTKPIYSARVTKDYRTLGLLENDTIIWFWIGSHADYDELISPVNDLFRQIATKLPRELPDDPARIAWASK